MVRIILFAFLVTSSLQAENAPNCASEDEFIQYEKPVVICNIPKKRLSISKNCFKDGEFKCDAYKAIDKVKKSKIEAEELRKFGGMSTGAAICPRIGGRGIVLQTKKEEENCFRQFNDKSMIDCNTLSYYIEKN